MNVDNLLRDIAKPLLDNGFVGMDLLLSQKDEVGIESIVIINFDHIQFLYMTDIEKRTIIELVINYIQSPTLKQTVIDFSPMPFPINTIIPADIFQQTVELVRQTVLQNIPNGKIPYFLGWDRHTVELKGYLLV